MAKKETAPLAYMVSIYDDPEIAGALLFTFIPKGEKAQYIVSVTAGQGEPVCQWKNPPEDDGIRQSMENIVGERVDIRMKWLQRLDSLVNQVKLWAQELDWTTRIIEKRMDDPQIGAYKAPALLLQQETVRLLLEPVSRTSPGTEGTVDLYLMPSYDDIASLYYYGDRWNVHYMFEGMPTVGNIREAEAKPLSKEVLGQVLDEMKIHAQ